MVDAVTLVKCIKVGEENFGNWTMVEPVKTCFMDVQTTIDSKGFSINERTANATYGLMMNYNKNIQYLPEDITEVFPYLMAYAAAHCAIEEIYKENFDGLTNLRFLNLAGNKISAISSNTFRSLISLERLSMTDNQIGSMSGNLLMPAMESHSLVQVWLKTNECIDENFTDEDGIKRLLMTLDDNCNGVSRGEVKSIMNEMMQKVEVMVDAKVDSMLKQIKGELKELKSMSKVEKSNKVVIDNQTTKQSSTTTTPSQEKSNP